MSKSSYTLSELASKVGGEASATPGPPISGARPLEHAREGDITYVAHKRYLEALEKSKAAAVVIDRDMDPGTRPAIWAPNPEACYARLTGIFYGYQNPPPGISEKADIDPTAKVDPSAHIGPFAVIGPRCSIGPNVVISAGVFVGADVSIGESTRLFPNVTIYHDVKIGARVIAHSGSVIGGDGFGFAPDIDSDGSVTIVKKYHSGTVEIGDDVEIGALCGIDRALAGVTKLGSGVKLDNQVQIAHSVQVGSGTVIAAQTGIAGSSIVGDNCMMGGQVGVRDHVRIGDGVVLATRVGIYRDVPKGAIMAGSVPAMPHNVFLRAQSLFKRLPEIFERVRKMERAINKLTGAQRQGPDRED
jgi:UDP-3-O-[3-hydroxymyristoyl] glucosamine N-acyltransferase